MLEEILELHKNGQFDQAEERYREWLLFNPDDPEVLHLLGILRRQQGDFREGMELVSRAISWVPDRANYHMTLGGMHFHLRQWDQAKVSFEAALKLNPNLTGAYSALGQIAMIQSDPGNAEQQFKTALRAREDDPQVLTSLGNLHMTHGNSELALKYLTRAAELSPEDAATQASLGRALFSHGMTAFAEQALNNALRLKPDFLIAKLVLAEVQLQLGRLAEAEQNFNALIAAGEHLAAAHAGLGDVAKTHGNLQKAFQHYQDSLAAKPDQPRIAIASAWCLRRLGQIESSIHILQDIFSLVPENATLCRALAGVLSEMGRHKEAATIWGKYSEKCPHDDLAFIHLACELELAENYAESTKIAQKIAARQFRNVDLNLLIARSSLRDKDPQSALSVLDNMDGNTLSVSQKRQCEHYRGLAFDQLNRFAEAVQVWQTAHRTRVENTSLPSLGAVSEELSGAIIAAASVPSETRIDSPIFLIGAPGSGVDRLASLLSDQEELWVLRDRFLLSGRRDGFTDPNFERYIYGIDTDTAHLFARRYQRALSRLTIPAHRKVVDWLPYWDARFLPLIIAALPNARLIIVQRDPRDTFLNWLAYGWSADFAITDPDAASQWLAHACAHEAACTKASTLSRIYIDSDMSIQNETKTSLELAQFLGISKWVYGLNFQRANKGLGGLPTAFPADHWQDYQHALESVFSNFGKK